METIQSRTDPMKALQFADKIGAPKGGYDLPVDQDASSAPMRKGVEVLKDPVSLLWEFIDNVLPGVGSGLFRKGK